MDVFLKESILYANNYRLDQNYGNYMKDSDLGIFPSIGCELRTSNSLVRMEYSGTILNLGQVKSLFIFVNLKCTTKYFKKA